MKKLFLLIPAMLLTLATYADPIPVAPGTNAIRDAVAAAQADAVLELSTGTYIEEGNFAITKNITIQAAEGAHPVIAQRYYIYFNNSAQVTFKGIKFDGGAYGDVGAYDHALRTYGSPINRDETLTLEKCEFANYPSYVIFIQRANRGMDAITITNCYFHNNARSAVYIGTEDGDTKQSCNSLTIENSTFAAVSEDYPVINYYAPEAEHTTTLEVNHCTFYNHPNRAIYWRLSTNLSVSNCIFAQPASVSYKSVECAGGTITNCLTYNTGGYSEVIVVDPLTGNPYFVNTDAENYDFTTASFSPAHNAGTDSKNLGDIYHWTSDDSAHPTTLNITADAANSLTLAVAGAWPGDTIVLASGTYSESEVIEFNKSLVIKAATEVKPVIAQHYYSKITTGADVKFIGIKFDGSIYPANDHCFYPFDNTVGNELHFENCEFVGFSSYVLYNGGVYSLDSLIVNNCFFHNNTKSSVIYFEKHATAGSQTVKGVKVTNSTFANNNTTPSYSVIFVRNQTGEMVSDVEVTVDHCTFYNNPTKDTDHSSIRSYKSTKVAISNCIFAHPEPVDLPATSCYGGTVSNCLTYNLNHYSTRNGHRQDGGQPVLSNNISGNPVFADPANNDFTLLNASSARRQNGDVYGDPRWIKAIQSIAIPSTLLPKDALLSDSASVILGTPDSINYKYVGNNKYNALEWAKWKVTVDKDGYYNFTANTYRATGQKYEIALLNSAETDTLILNDNGKAGIGSGNASISTGKIALTAGNTYVIRVRNIYEYADGVLLNVVASYQGGVTVAVPDTLWPVDALRSEEAFVENDSLHFTTDDHSGNVREQWAKWNISVAEVGKYKFTANAYSTNGQNYRITLKNSTETSTIGTWYGPNNDSGKRLVSTELIDLVVGNYVVMIEDTVRYSHGRIANIVASYEGGKTVNIPGQILAKEAVIGTVANGRQKMYHLMENGDLKYDNNGYNMEEFATWTINATEAGEMEVTFNIAKSGHIFSIELYQGETRLDSIGESDATKWDGGDITLAEHLTFPAAGAYTLKLLNNQQHSGGALHGITFTPYVAPGNIVIDEMDEDNSAFADKVGGAAVNVQLKRTFKGGIYSTFCVPFEATMAQVKAAFGDDVELLYLFDASLEGGVLNLVFAKAPDIYQGTPYLVKPSADVDNPTFNGVRLLADEAASTSHTGWPASFRGTFVKQTLTANPNNLFLGQDNKLYFSNSAVEIWGLRAYFNVNVSNASSVIKRAALITPNNTPTEIEIVGAETNGTIKTIENGQLVIIRDGIRYNMMGQRF